MTIITIWLAVGLTNTAWADATGFSFRYLTEPAVKWENNRLTGKVKNVPTDNLLVELLRHEGYQWDVKGNLGGNSSINVDNATIEESVREIMRQGNYNYTLIMASPKSSDGSNLPKISELTIYQGDKIIRFSRSPQRISVSSKTENIRPVRKPRQAKTPAAMPAKQLAASVKAQKALPAKLSKEKHEEMDKQLKEIADDMLAKKEITPEQYEEIIKVIGRVDQ